MSARKEFIQERFGSRFSVLMTMLGVSIGLANVWRFPYMVGRYGGAAFLIIYLLCLFLLGIPALMGEWTLGRSLRGGPVTALRKAGLPGGRFLGFFLVASLIMAVAYYDVVIGWTLRYFIASFFSSSLHQNSVAFFQETSTRMDIQFFFTALSTLIIVAIPFLGIKKGIEKVSTYTMPILFILLLVLLVRAVTLDGAEQGIWFYLRPDFSKLNPESFLAAVGQVFFSLGLGGTLMVVYSSYLSDAIDLPKSAIITAIGDTSAGFIAGLVVFPAVFAFGLEPTQGPPLTFIILPKVFSAIKPGGWIYGGLFFLVLFWAAVLSALAAFEVIANTFALEFGVARRKTLIGVAIFALLVGLIPMSGTRILAFFDLVFGSTMQALGSAIVLLVLGWRIGSKVGLQGIQKGTQVGGLRVWFSWIKYVVPPIIIIILINGWFGG